MVIEIWTARVGYAGGDRLDISVAGASRPDNGLGAILAPSWDLVWGIKRGEIGEQEYEGRYLAMLRKRYRQDPCGWDVLLDKLARQGSVTLCCYCPKGAFCHRVIAAEKVLKPLLLSRGFEVVLKGER